MCSVSECYRQQLLIHHISLHDNRNAISHQLANTRHVLTSTTSGSFSSGFSCNPNIQSQHNIHAPKVNTTTQNQCDQPKSQGQCSTPSRTANNTPIKRNQQHSIIQPTTTSMTFCFANSSTLNSSTQLNSANSSQLFLPTLFLPLSPQAPAAQST